MNRKMMKGNIAIAEGAIHAGCRHYFGYPITPQNDIPEFLSAELPKIGGVFVQAESEVASINMILGASAAGARAMTSSSGPGVSLMQEGISYLAGSELPAVIVDVSRTGPGLGGIAPSQGDYKQVASGGGHGDYYTIALAPASVQEMFELVQTAFDLADKYRNPAILLTDAILGQMKEPVVIGPRPEPKRQNKPWALTGNKGRSSNMIKSLFLGDGEMEVQNWKLADKYERLKAEDTMYEEIWMDDAEFIIVSFGSCSRMVQSAIRLARDDGLKVGLIRPITIYPFPEKIIKKRTESLTKVLVVEMNTGQMVKDVKISVSRNADVFLYARPGGALPTPLEILEQIKKYY
ncbi:MAG: 3-methyl-2-oxobutanoate dehydrogenase subunit VorB [Deltaproteobacteria bacterium]|nr:3-methyl-2-oxobutanoate dehydrogenase subunit VorB [Deltaproteobacteria bacterium]